MYLDLQLKIQCSEWVQISSMLIILISFFGRHFTAGDRHWISIFYIQMIILPQQQTTILSYSFRSVYWRCNILTEAPEIAEIEESIGAKLHKRAGMKYPPMRDNLWIFLMATGVNITQVTYLTTHKTNWFVVSNDKVCQ